MADLGVWGLWWALGGAVVLIAALLLIWILLAARGIEREARRALVAARRVEANTRPIWRLQGAREALEAARDHVEAAEAQTARLLADPHAPAGEAAAKPPGARWRASPMLSSGWRQEPRRSTTGLPAWMPPCASWRSGPVDWGKHVTVAFGR